MGVELIQMFIPYLTLLVLRLMMNNNGSVFLQKINGLYLKVQHVIPQPILLHMC